MIRSQIIEILNRMQAVYGQKYEPDQMSLLVEKLLTWDDDRIQYAQKNLEDSRRVNSLPLWTSWRSCIEGWQSARDKTGEKTNPHGARFANTLFKFMVKARAEYPAWAKGRPDAKQKVTDRMLEIYAENDMPVDEDAGKLIENFVHELEEKRKGAVDV